MKVIQDVHLPTLSNIHVHEGYISQPIAAEYYLLKARGTGSVGPTDKGYLTLTCNIPNEP